MSVYIARKNGAIQVFESLKDAENYADSISDIETVQFIKKQTVTRPQPTREQQEKHILEWIVKVFSKAHPANLLHDTLSKKVDEPMPAHLQGKNNLLHAYVDEFIKDYPDCNPLIKRASVLLNSEYTLETPTTLLKDCNIFKFQTLAYDIEDYLEQHKLIK